MENYSFILGVDVSKLTLDISCAELRLYLKIGNDSKGFAEFKKWCKANAISLSKTFIVMEHTGGYEYRFIQFCDSLSIAYSRISPLEIKRSMGMTRGKNFNSFSDGRKYAVYVGVIPFENSSGTSIKGKMRTSVLSSRDLKQELNQAAKVAIAHDPELRAYADRKLKNKWWPVVLNNVKFKLILRMFSLIKRREMYVEKYKRVA